MRKLTYIAIVFILFTCQTKKSDPIQEFKGFEQPTNFPEPVYNLNKNPVTPAGFKLGKALFYDGILSADGSISCGTCHQQPFAFSHHEHDVSHGINDRLGIRNSISLQNLAWQKEFFYDGGVIHLDLFPPAPIENENEMGEKLSNVLNKLRSHSKYPAMFREAFGSEEVNTERFVKALSQFMVTMVSANSRYDKYIRQESGGNLTNDELQGLELFRTKCAACHTEPLFTDLSYRDNGLKPTPKPDNGRERITQNPTDRFRFKVPSLRNIAFSRPYMHDGRFQTLAQVLDHYQKGVQANANLDPLLKTSPTPGIALTDEQKQKIILFLQTLTDEAYLNDSRFSEFNNTIK